jgi:hypothetical protein
MIRYYDIYSQNQKQKKQLWWARSACKVTLIKQSWKCIRRSAAGTVLSFDAAFLTAYVMIDSAWGHVFS